MAYSISRGAVLYTFQGVITTGILPLDAGARLRGVHLLEVDKIAPSYLPAIRDEDLRAPAGNCAPRPIWRPLLGFRREGRGERSSGHVGGGREQVVTGGTLGEPRRREAFDFWHRCSDAEGTKGRAAGKGYNGALPSIGVGGMITVGRTRRFVVARGLKNLELWLGKWAT